MSIKKMHLWAGLIVAAYVIPHVLNHALGLVSLDAMEAVRRAIHVVWVGPVGEVVLFGAFATHFFLALWTLYTRSTLRMPAWEAIQILLGLLIFPLILVHIAGTSGVRHQLGYEPTYEYVIAALWVADPMRGLQQAVMLVVVWAHLCVGLHFWLRMYAWYRAALPYAYAVMILIPVLSLLGFSVIGRLLSVRAEMDPGYLGRLFGPIFVPAMADMVAQLKLVEPNGWLVFTNLILSVLIARVVRHYWRRRHGSHAIRLPDGRRIDAPNGQTILETLRINGIPHASVCGGRGRCTTCRVDVGEASGHLPPPGEVEAKALARVHAEPHVRLACQTRPSSDIAIHPLLPASATPRDVDRPGVMAAREQTIAVMFLDIRGSTRLGERKLPYDVLFTLNQFFAEMSAALTETGGHYSNFTGDGLMAMYGVTGRIEDGCRNAIKGAAAMLARLDELNKRYAHDLPEPLRMGLGIHCGEVIVGSMGPPTAQAFTAIGDAVNVTARLEALTKDFGCALVVSEEAAAHAGFDMSGCERRTTGVRGRVGEISVYAVNDPRALTALN